MPSSLDRCCHKRSSVTTAYEYQWNIGNRELSRAEPANVFDSSSKPGNYEARPYRNVGVGATVASFSTRRRGPPQFPARRTPRVQCALVEPEFERFLLILLCSDSNLVSVSR